MDRVKKRGAPFDASLNKAPGLEVPPPALPDATSIPASTVELIRGAENDNTYPIAQSLLGSCSGDGWVAGRLKNGELVAVRYLVEMSPELAEPIALGEPFLRPAVEDWIRYSLAFVKFLDDTWDMGDPTIGIISAHEFIAL